MDFLSPNSQASQVSLEYLDTYHLLKDLTFRRGFGVRVLCKVNRQISSLAVPDADQRRAIDKGWRGKSASVEKVFFTIGNTVHFKAIEVSTNVNLTDNLLKASRRTRAIYDLLEAPL